MVTFVLPTKKENDWVRTGRGFIAVRLYKAHKKGTGTMKTIKVQQQVIRQVEVEVQVRDDADIDNFLQALIDHLSSSGVDQVLRLATPPIEMDRAGVTELLVKEELERLKGEYRNDPQTNVNVSNWLNEAEDVHCYPLTDSKDETDNEAIAEATQAPSATDKQGDYHMDSPF